jgi:hypothetical protein
MWCNASKVDGYKDQRVVAVDSSVLRDRIDEQVDITFVHFAAQAGRQA